jgi:diguanylate cyclase (GGDEF)-like protein
VRGRGRSLPVAGATDRIRVIQGAREQAEETARRSLETRQEELEGLVAGRTAELEQVRDDAQRFATIDPLTGILNRRGMLERANEAAHLALRAHRPLAIVTFDIDLFKEVNDRHGHAEGDRVLRKVVATVFGAVRATDLFGRVGGEEFLLVLPETTRDGAVELAERFRARIAAAVLVGESRTPVTASFGIAWLAGTGDDLESLQRAADAALYRAKRNGRNRGSWPRRSKAPFPDQPDERPRW